VAVHETAARRLLVDPAGLGVVRADHAGVVMIHLNGAVADGLLVSVAVTTTIELPPLVGVPVISPVVWLIDSPAGRPVAV
jgi:hypothetical protein